MIPNHTRIFHKINRNKQTILFFIIKIVRNQSHDVSQTDCLKRNIGAYYR